MNTKLETTKDGSHTLYVPELNEHYHSTNGAIQEARHVFIESALNYCKKKEIKVLEIGFGTGLNAFLTMLEAEISDKSIKYTSLEYYPVSLNDIEKLNYANLINKSKKDLFTKLHSVDWEINNPITPFFSITKKRLDFSNPDNFTTYDKYDVVFFDAFGPEKQPEMWHNKVFEKIYSIMSNEGILTTYSAKGVVRRMLQSTGFIVERLPGPPGKREMLRATKWNK